MQARKQAIKQASREASRQARKQASRQGSRQACNHASKQALGRHSVGAMPWRGLFSRNLYYPMSKVCIECGEPLPSSVTKLYLERLFKKTKIQLEACSVRAVWRRVWQVSRVRGHAPSPRRGPPEQVSSQTSPDQWGPLRRHPEGVFAHFDHRCLLQVCNQKFYSNLQRMNTEP